MRIDDDAPWRGWLNEAMNLSGHTPHALADSLIDRLPPRQGVRVRPAVVSRWLAGGDPPDAETVAVIACALGADPAGGLFAAGYSVLAGLVRDAPEVGVGDVARLVVSEPVAVRECGPVLEGVVAVLTGLAEQVQRYLDDPHPHVGNVGVD